MLEKCQITRESYKEIIMGEHKCKNSKGKDSEVTDKFWFESYMEYREKWLHWCIANGQVANDQNNI